MINVLLGAIKDISPVLLERRETILEATVKVCSPLLPCKPKESIEKRDRGKKIVQVMHSCSLLTKLYQNYAMVWHAILSPCHCGFRGFCLMPDSQNTKQRNMRG